MDCKSLIAVATLIFATAPTLADAQYCAPDLPELSVFDEHFANKGQARNAYQLAAKERAVAISYCGCPYDGWPFGLFIAKKAGMSVDDLTQSTIRDLRQWSDENGVSILRQYRAQYIENCGEEQ